MQGDCPNSANAYQVAYTYDAADQLIQIMYPSGRIVSYARGDTGKIINVTSSSFPGNPFNDIATLIVRFPHSGIIKSYDAGNGLSIDNTVDQDHAVTLLSVKDGAWDKLYRTYARGDNLNLTGITDYVDVANGMSFGYSPANRHIDMPLERAYVTCNDCGRSVCHAHPCQ